MKDLSVLTPPLLTCAVVLFAIGAFLRHEMSRHRPDRDPDEPDDNSDAEPNQGQGSDSGPQDADPHTGSAGS